MLYNSDINGLLSQWEDRLKGQSPDYRIAVSDCIYDLKCLMDKQLADEAFEHQLEEDSDKWDDYFNNLLADGIFA